MRMAEHKQETSRMIGLMNSDDVLNGYDYPRKEYESVVSRGWERCGRGKGPHSFHRLGTSFHHPMTHLPTYNG